MSIETNGILLEIDQVLKLHLQQQMEKILEENKKMKSTLEILKHTPLFRKIVQENKELRKNNNILAKNILKLQKKIEKYENFQNINLEIKEMPGNNEEKVTAAEINWAKIVNSKLESEENNLQQELEMAGITELEEKEESDDDDDDDDDDEDDDDDDEEEDDGPLDIWNLNQDDEQDDEISDDEDSAKIFIFQDKKYYIEDKENGKIFENIEGKIGKVVGRLENGVPFFS